MAEMMKKVWELESESGMFVFGNEKKSESAMS